MTYKFYKRFLLAYFFLFVPLLFLNQYADKIPWIKSYPLFLVIIFFAKPVFAVFLLYFGIYAYKWRIKTAHKIEGPITIIILGSLFTLISLGPPIIGYFMAHDVEIQILSTAKLRGMKSKSISPDTRAEERLSAARYYYIQTGELIEYLDANGEKKAYSPSDNDRKEREYNIHLNRQLATIISERRTRIITLIVFGILSCLGFLVFLWYKTRMSKIS